MYFTDLVLDPRLPSCLSFALRCGHLENKNNLGKQSTHRAATKHEAQTRSLPALRRKGKYSYSRVPKRCLLSSSTGVELLVLFAECLVALLQAGSVCRDSRIFESFRGRRDISALALARAGGQDAGGVSSSSLPYPLVWGTLLSGRFETRTS